MEFHQTVYIKAHLDQFWDALTNPSLTGKFFPAPLECIGSQPGAQIRFSEDGKTFATGEILEIQRSLLSHTFAFPKNVIEEPSKVIYAIAEQERISKLNMSHICFESSDPSYEACAECWPLILSRIKTWMETGELDDSQEK